MKYKFVIRSPLTVGEEVCIDKKTLVPRRQHLCPESCKAAFFKLWSADHKWSSGSALVVLLD